MAKAFGIGGHRGMGCTDHDFYQSRRDVAHLPVENTLESVTAAFKAGCDYVEIDAVMSADSQIFTLHNIVPDDHFFGAAKPSRQLNTLHYDELAVLGTGRHGMGRITPLAGLLGVVAQLDPGTLPFAVNIEIKGVQGSGQPFESNDYIRRLAETVRQSALPVSRVLFSSFALANIIAMSHELPEARYGMLFAEQDEPRPIYADWQGDARYQYLPYNKGYARRTVDTWAGEAKGKLGYFHPEFMTLNDNTIPFAVQHGVDINCWALFEDMTPARRQRYDDIAALCATAGVSFTAITDYIGAFR